MDEIKYETIWEPKEDITVYELARCLHYSMSKIHAMDEWDKLDESITRHFRVSEFNYGEMIRENAKKIKELFDV